MTYIYCLICPLDNVLKYIGKANNPERRAKDHMFDIRGMTPDKIEWVGQMRKYKKKPILEILDEVEEEEWQFWEGWWMEYFRGMGVKLINSNRSGNGLTYSTKQTFKPGNRPWNKKKLL